MKEERKEEDVTLVVVVELIEMHVVWHGLWW